MQRLIEYTLPMVLIALLITLAITFTEVASAGPECEYRGCSVQEDCRPDCGADVCCVSPSSHCQDLELPVWKQHYCTPEGYDCMVNICAWSEGCSVECEPE